MKKILKTILENLIPFRSYTAFDRKSMRDSRYYKIFFITVAKVSA